MRKLPLGGSPSTSSEAGILRLSASTSFTFLITNVISSSISDHEGATCLWLFGRLLGSSLLVRCSGLVVAYFLDLESMGYCFTTRHWKDLTIRWKERRIGIVPIGG